MFLWLKTSDRKRAFTWPFIFYTIIWTLSRKVSGALNKSLQIAQSNISKKIKLLPRIVWILNRILFSCDIPHTAQIHPTVTFGHNGLGVVIHSKARIGRNTLIMQNVTIGGNLGRKRSSDGEEFSSPRIGKNVFIGPNVSIIGPVIIGDNARIGAGSVVMDDIPQNGIAVGTPARTIKIQTDKEVMKVQKIGHHQYKK